MLFVLLSESDGRNAAAVRTPQGTAACITADKRTSGIAFRQHQRLVTPQFGRLVENVVKWEGSTGNSVLIAVARAQKKSRRLAMAPCWNRLPVGDSGAANQF
jgi:hypothetical protein